MELKHYFVLLLSVLNGVFHVTGVAPKGHPKEMKTKSVEKNLIRMLLNRYEQFGVIGRPVNDSKIKVDVRYGLQLFQILDLDENKQILRTNCWSMYKWTDSLLRWNESDYGNIKTVRIFPSQIWTPDIKLYNFADERLREHRDARVVVSSNGEMLWVPQALFKSTCEVEITYFPFDTQICMLEFGSWTYDRTQMDILWWIPDAPPMVEMPYLDFSDYVPSNEWRTDGEKERDVHHINRTIQIRSVKKHRRRSQTVGSEVITREYPVLRYLIRLRRNPSFYVFMLVIPCVLLSSLTLVVFWLPPESPAKMMLGMNIFVAFFVLLLLLAESTPSAVKNFPLIGVYFCLNMIMITLSTDRNGSVPSVLRRIVIEGIGRLTLVRQRIPLPEMKKPIRPIATKPPKKIHILNRSPNKYPAGEESPCQDERSKNFGTGSFPPCNMAGSHHMYGEDYLGNMTGNWFGPNEHKPGPRYGGPYDSYAAATPIKGTPQISGNLGQAGPKPLTNEPNDGTNHEESPSFLNSTTTLERDVRELKKYVKIEVHFLEMKLTFYRILTIYITCGLLQITAVAPVGHPKVMKTKSVEKDLIRMLLSRYERFGVIGRPVNDSKIKVDVRYGLQLFQILDLDENKQILRTNCWCMHKWNDSLLRWNESEYGNIKTVSIFPSQIWTPDIKLNNFADERIREHRDARAVVSSNGEILWVPQALLKSTCEVEITYFPFDSQICMLEFGSLTYDRTQMDLLWWIPDAPPLVEMPYLDFSEYARSNEWRTDGEEEQTQHHINRTIQIRSVKKYRRLSQVIGNEVVTLEYPVLRYLIRLRRHPSFYVIILVIPCILLSSLMSVVFWLPPESPAKMMLGVNIFVAFFVLLLLLAESTPSAVKNFPLIGVFYCLNMIMITLSTFLTTLVIHLHFRGDRKGSVPLFLRRIVIEGIGRLTLVRQRIPLPEMKKPIRPIATKPPKKIHILNRSPNKYPAGEESPCQDERSKNFGTGSFPPCNMAGSHHMYGEDYLGNMTGNWFGPNEHKPGPRYGGPYDSYAAATPIKGTPQISGNLGQAGPKPLTNEPNDGTNHEESPSFLNSTTTLERDVRELKKYVKMLVNRQKETARKSLVAMEWRTLAIVLDLVVSVPRSTEPELPPAFRDD
uniref:Neur_chan_LBD domain-containing protein n=1 Tax=Trichobilharzia regenti TaxID=157069 RepID=A0AA85JEI8_TRIRE|nr:unnamed protein product [Trichobilharzia regenti]